MRTRGFTLIEVLVALTVAGAAAAVILAQIHGLMRRADQERRHQDMVSGLLNDSARLAAIVIAEAHQQLGDEKISLQPSGQGLPTVEVSNISVAGEKVLPPIRIAYTPFQRYSVVREGRALSFLAPALPAVSTVRSPISPSSPLPAAAAKASAPAGK
ncbi:MAG TPA: prepilin-type N-terminal cleavage/methylation domain-containing protein [Rhodocyclaceae bacterium]